MSGRRYHMKNKEEDEDDEIDLVRRNDFDFESVLEYIAPQYYWFPIILFICSIPVFETYTYSTGGLVVLYISLMMYYNYIKLPAFFGSGWTKLFYCTAVLIGYFILGFIWARFGRWYLFIYSESQVATIQKITTLDAGISYVRDYKGELFTHAIFWPFSLGLSLANDVIAQIWNMIIEYSEKHMAQDLLNRAKRLA